MTTNGTVGHSLGLRVKPRLRGIVATVVGTGATAATIAYALGAPAAREPVKAECAGTPTATTSVQHDWDFLVGRWNVKHRRLKARLAGSKEWEEFNGTSTEWLTMGGAGTVDDNVIELPSGTYRAVGVRAYDPKSTQWSIWWLDERHPTAIEPPVMGGFKDGVGTFVGDDTFNGRPIKVRFRWSKITANSAHWDQAFSPDNGATWETNWDMDFTRASR
jgi:hypothetical protein